MKAGLTWKGWEVGGPAPPCNISTSLSPCPAPVSSSQPGAGARPIIAVCVSWSFSSGVPQPLVIWHWAGSYSAFTFYFEQSLWGLDASAIWQKDTGQSGHSGLFTHCPHWGSSLGWCVGGWQGRVRVGWTQRTGGWGQLSVDTETGTPGASQHCGPRCGGYTAYTAFTVTWACSAVKKWSNSNFIQDLKES